MINWSAAFLLLALGSAAQRESAEKPPPVTQVIIREQILVRVPLRLRQLRPSAQPLIEWKEKRGPKCVPIQSILGATQLGQRSVDLLLRDQSRMRAKLENDCPALDFYYGFYVSRSSDGQICADRDFIRSRVGRQCEIEKFRTLQPAVRD